MAQAQVTALDLWLAEQQTPGLVLPTGCDSIDELLGGGFRYGLLTEVCGEASAGKTQLCLQLLLHCRLPRRLGGLASSACYICTEGIGSIKRLYELAGSYAEKYGPLVSGGKRKRDSESVAAEGGQSTFLDGIFIEQLYELNGLLDVLVCVYELLKQTYAFLVSYCRLLTHLIASAAADAVGGAEYEARDHRLHRRVVPPGSHDFCQGTAHSHARVFLWMSLADASVLSGSERAITHDVPRGQLHAHSECAVSSGVRAHEPSHWELHERPSPHAVCSRQSCRW